MDDPFGEKRGLFQYGRILLNLTEVNNRLLETSMIDDEAAGGKT